MFRAILYIPCRQHRSLPRDRNDLVIHGNPARSEDPINFTVSASQHRVRRQLVQSSGPHSELIADVVEVRGKQPHLLALDLRHRNDGIASKYLKTCTLPYMTWSVCVNSECSHSKTMK